MRTEPRVVCLKGRIHAYGPTLENAPRNLIYVGRACYMGGWRLPKSIWANPFSVQKMGGADRAVAAYEKWMLQPEQAGLRARIGELAGMDLACWCAPTAKACHARPLLRWVRYGFPAISVTASEPEPAHWSSWPVDFGGRPDVALPVYRSIATIRPTGQWAGAL